MKVKLHDYQAAIVEKIKSMTPEEKAKMHWALFGKVGLNVTIESKNK